MCWFSFSFSFIICCELEDRVETGDTRPDADQIAKMNRKPEVLAEIKQLEAKLS